MPAAGASDSKHKIHGSGQRLGNGLITCFSGGTLGLQPDDRRFTDWLAGKVVPVRARIVSEPLADYIRFEHAITDEVNIPAWVPPGRIPQPGP